MTFERYYMNQAAGDLPVFVGAASQRGYGLGNVLNSAFRAFMPALKSAGKTILKQGLQTGAQVLGDVVQGKNIKQAFKRRATQGGQRLVNRALDSLAAPRKKVKRAKTKAQSTKPKRGVGRRERDIFSS
jgi:hypothetical protein